MKTFRFLLFLGALLLTTPIVHAQDYLAKAKEFLEQGDCERARLAYEDYKKYVNPQGNAELWRRIELCGKVALPTVFTLEPTSITATTVTYRSYVLDDGGDGRDVLSSRGVCWSTAHQPTLNDNVVDFGTGTEIRFRQITGLREGTTYYVRAYATNAAGTAYGEEVSFTTLSRPSVKTLGVENSTATSATCGGNVTKDGGASITARGVCWSTSHYPSINDKYTSNGSGTGRYTSNLSGLKAGTTYYVRAYATNEVGTVYGEEVSFTTKAIGDCGTVTDYDGNVYSTVIIGNQCWMKENLKVTRDYNGKYISSSKEICIKEINTSISYRYYPDNEFDYVSTYGFLYNWNAAMRVCPYGWHLPSDTEWKQLELAVGMSISDANKEDLRGSIASKISGNRGWESSSKVNAAGNFSAPERNKTGFSALPSGMVLPIYGNVRMGKTAAFWCSDGDGDNAWLRILGSDGAEVGRTKTTKSAGCSVRCVRD